jgi:hypothetical protein
MGQLSRSTVYKIGMWPWNEVLGLNKEEIVLPSRDFWWNLLARCSEGQETGVIAPAPLKNWRGVVDHARKKKLFC